MEELLSCEIKCPYSHRRDDTIKAHYKNFCMKRGPDGVCYLDHSHAYCKYQVQARFFCVWCCILMHIQTVRVSHKLLEEQANTQRQINGIALTAVNYQNAGRAG